MRKLYFIALGLTGLLWLGGCGIKGDLDRPPPLWGDESKAQRDNRPPDQPVFDSEPDYSQTPDTLNLPPDETRQ